MLDVTATFGFLAAATERCAWAPASPSCRSATRSHRREMCTLDWLTDGRIGFRIGVGWNKEEVGPAAAG
jgi:alkanesulfonate monooxygenase SsuD/methylene tetrahydromethanopterin reductase-like flavin-dependent oxidoreductase (luciferase family)